MTVFMDYGAVIMARPLWDFSRFIWWMQTEHQIAANPQTKPTDLACESATTTHIHYRHLLVLLSPKADTHLPSHGGWKAEST